MQFVVIVFADVEGVPGASDLLLKIAGEEGEFLLSIDAATWWAVVFV